MFRFCKEFHCLPGDVLGMEDHWYELFCEFLRLESEADMMEAKRREQLPPS